MSKRTLEQSQLKTGFGTSPKKLVEAMPALASDFFSKPLTKNQRRIKGERQKSHSPEKITEEFRVDSTGNLFFRIPRPGRSIHRPAGSVRQDGYRAVRLKGQIYLAHRVVWCLTQGQWPKEQIDHIDGNRLNNRPENLRAATVVTNGFNVTKARNASGCVGITWSVQNNNWRASINHNGRSINLGHFSSLEAAINYRKTAEQLFGYTQKQSCQNN